MNHEYIKKINETRLSNETRFELYLSISERNKCVSIHHTCNVVGQVSHGSELRQQTSARILSPVLHSMNVNRHHCYFPRQFTWRLHYMAVILVLLVMTWFMKRDGRACTNRSNNIMRYGIRSVVVLNGSAEQSMRIACFTNLPPC
jgi:uncharacterized membrane protein